MCNECNWTDKKKKCINCGVDEHLQIYTNPYNPHTHIIACYKCSEIPFREYTNREFMKPWWKDEP